jgi:hypothetical protein
MTPETVTRLQHAIRDAGTPAGKLGRDVIVVPVSEVEDLLKQVTTVDTATYPDTPAPTLFCGTCGQYRATFITSNDGIDPEDSKFQRCCSVCSRILRRGDTPDAVLYG